MLGHLVSNAARLIRPYMDPILKVLLYMSYESLEFLTRSDTNQSVQPRKMARSLTFWMLVEIY